MKKDALHPPFSPILIAGILSQPVPLYLVDKILEHITSNLQKNHPSILERLEVIENKKFLISPTDLPFSIIITFQKDEIISVATKENDIESDVRIFGSISSLVKMLDGEVDGDALFFSRELIVEGDTEALLTLRNSMDADDINILYEMLDSFGILGPIIENFIKPTQKVSTSLSDNMNLIKNSLLGSVIEELESQEAYIDKLNEKISSLQKEQSKQQAKINKILRDIKK